jgi:DNA-binding response OmpR family regulator
MATSLKILLVEDNPHILMLFASALRERGHQVIEADNGEKALLLGSMYGPDLILLDIGLPGMSGMSVASELRGHPAMAECPIIAVTARRLSRADMDEVGIVATIEKPIMPQALADRIEQWWQKRGDA